MSEDTKTAPTPAEEPKAKKPSPKKPNEKEKLKAELEQTKDLLLRTAAEYDNFKRRSEKEKQDLSEYVRAATVKKLLGVADNIRRAQDSDSSSPDYVKGLEMIVKQLTDALRSRRRANPSIPASMRRSCTSRTNPSARIRSCRCFSPVICWATPFCGRPWSRWPTEPVFKLLPI